MAWEQSKLTIVRQDAKELTERAVELLLEKVKQWRIMQEPPMPQGLLLPY